MKFIIDIIKGMFVGVANIIPGVSGGTMAVSFGIYDKILSSISNIFKDFKKSIKTLLPIGIGMAIGIIGFSFIITILLKNQPFITASSFTGLILGGLPMILASLKEGLKMDKKKSIPINVIVFVIFLTIAIILPFINGGEDTGVLLTSDFKTIVIVFFMGLIAAAAMVIPGVSGSLVLMILGYYFGILASVKNFISALKDLNISELLEECKILIPFALGCLVGIIFISKLIEWLFNHFISATYCGILGLILASPIAVFYKVQQEYDMLNSSIPQIIIGVVCLVLCFGLTIFIGKLDEKQDKDKNIEQA